MSHLKSLHLNLLTSFTLFFCYVAHLRVVCDALNIVFLFDDYSDIQEPQIVREVADTIVDALYNPSAHPKPHVEDHGRFGEITRRSVICLCIILGIILNVYVVVLSML